MSDKIGCLLSAQTAKAVLSQNVLKSEMKCFMKFMFLKFYQLQGESILKKRYSLEYRTILYKLFLSSDLHMYMCYRMWKGFVHN